MQLDEVSGVSWVSTMKASFDDMIQNLNYVIILIIVSAGALAFVVLFLFKENKDKVKEIKTGLGAFDQD